MYRIPLDEARPLPNHPYSYYGYDHDYDMTIR